MADGRYPHPVERIARQWIGWHFQEQGPKVDLAGTESVGEHAMRAGRPVRKGHSRREHRLPSARLSPGAEHGDGELQSEFSTTTFRLQIGVGVRRLLPPRTVGYHLYKAYPKIRLGSRAELARLLTGEDRSA